MGLWMMKFEVEGHLGVERGRAPLVFKHPAGCYEVHLENVQMEPGAANPLVNCYVVFENGDLEEAIGVGEKHVRRFLDSLCFATGSRFARPQRACIFDWSPDQTEARQGFVFTYFPNPEVPQQILTDEHARTVELLMSADPGTNNDVMQALRWFSVAVSASGQEEQFEFFWFALETIARMRADRSKVPDRCAMCREPLFCRKCERVTEHRPYPTQAIRTLFDTYVQGEPQKLFDMCSKMRHALMHGDQITKVEDQFGMKLGTLVDQVGRLAWVVVLDCLLKTSTQTGTVKLRLVQASTFLHQRQEVYAHIAVGFALGRTPGFAEIPHLQINRHLQERPLADEEQRSRLSPYLSQVPNESQES